MDLAAWRDLSLIWLIFLAFIIGIVPLVIFYFVVRGVMALNRYVSRYLKLGQYYSGIVRDQTRKYSLQLAQPVTKAHGEAARVRTILQRLKPHSTHADQGGTTP